MGVERDTRIGDNRGAMFGLRVALLIVIAALAAAMLAPIAAVALAAAGFQVPFPRIFDRTITVTLLAALVLDARRLRLAARLRRAFAIEGGRARALTAGALGFAISLAGIGVLWMIALALDGAGRCTPADLAPRLPGFILSTLAIAMFEEAFFRAFLLGGLSGDFGARSALVASAAIYALAHLVRSPARFYLTGYAPLAGFQVLGASLAHMMSPAAIPALIGLFLLGLLLGEAFLASGAIYLSIGLHAGVVVGAKSWRIVAPATDAIPRWLSGWGDTPLISGAAAWLLIVVLLALIGPLGRAARPSDASEAI